MLREEIKIASCTGGFRNLGFEETLLILKEIGFKYVEGTTDSRAHIYEYVFEKKDPQKLKETLSKSGLKLVAVSGGWSDFGVVDKCLERQYDSLRKQFQFCQKLGVKILRIFASHIPGQYIDKELIQRVIRNLKRIVPEAETNNTILVMENHFGITAKADDVLRIIGGVNHPNLRVNFDPANFMPMKEDPVRACKKLLPFIGHLHLKDIKKVGKTNEDAYLTGRGIKEGYEYFPIGEGEVNYPKILSLLSEENYQGIYSIEYENPSDVTQGMKVSFQNLKKILNL